MKNITSITLLNLKKGIATAQSRINKGLTGKSLMYAIRYIKGTKTKISKILKKNSQNSDIINNVNKKMKIYKKIKKIAIKMVKKVKMVMDKLIKKSKKIFKKNSQNSDIINNVNKKDKKMALPEDFKMKIQNIDLDDEEIFNNEIDLIDKYSEWYE